MLPTCEPNAKPFVIGQYDRPEVFSYTVASTPGEACQIFAYFAHQTIVDVTTVSCKVTGQAGYSFPIIQACEVDQNVLKPERVQDLLQLFYLSIAFLVVIYGAKKLLSLFDREHHEA